MEKRSIIALKKTHLQQKAPLVGMFMKCRNDKMINAPDLAAEIVVSEYPFREQNVRAPCRIEF